MMTTETTFIQLVGGVGFPIVITMYLLIKFDKTINHNTGLLVEIKQLIKERLK